MARKLLLAMILLGLMGGTTVGQEPIWRSYVELEGRAGGPRERGQSNLFLPLWQDDAQLLFVDMRGQWTDMQTAEGNLGLAFRRILPSEWIVGVYGFYDLRHRRQAGNHQQASIGAELLNVNWGFRLNGYIPDGRPEEVSALNVAFLQGNNIFVRRGEERAYYGVDLEVERLLWIESGPRYDGAGCRWRTALANVDAEVWAAVGAFHFDNDTAGFENMTGPRARLELRLHDLPLLGDDSRLVAAGQYEHDDVRGGVATGTLTVRIPFGPQTRNRWLLGPLDRRMVTPIVRDVDIITNIALSPFVEPARFARTGAAITNVVTVDATTPNAKADIESAGANSIAIADGSAGIIDTSAAAGPTFLNPGQVLMGGGAQLSVLGFNTGAAATFTAPGTRGTIDSGPNTTVATADNACLHGLDLSNSGNFGALALFGHRNVLIEDVGITTTGFGAVGIFSNGNSLFDVRDSTITTSNDFAAGILAFDESNFRITNSSIFTAGANANGIEVFSNAPNGLIFALNNSTISTTAFDANGILSSGISKYAVNNSTITTGGNFSDGVQSFDSSVYVVNGGSITTTGFGARGINAIASNFNQEFLLNVVEINSADDGVLMDGTVFGAGRIDGTINGTTINAGAGAFIHEIDMLVDNGVVLCLDAAGNFLDNAAGTINVDTFTSGTLNVNQLAPSAAVNERELDDANRIPLTNVFQTGTGMLNFDAGPCFNPGTFDLAPLELRANP